MSLDQYQRYPCITKWKARFGTGGLVVDGLTMCTGGITVPNGATATFGSGSTENHASTETHTGTCTFSGTLNLNGTTNFGAAGTVDFSCNVVVGHSGATTIAVNSTATFGQQVTCSAGVISGSTCAFTGQVTLGAATVDLFENGRRIPSYLNRNGGDYTLTTYYQCVRFRGLSANMTFTLGITGLTTGTQMVITNRGSTNTNTITLASSTSGTFGVVAHETSVTVWWNGTTWEFL